MLEPGMKLVQFILLPVIYDGVDVVEKIDWEDSQRGEGGFGSTGK
jgi:dUTPase